MERVKPSRPCASSQRLSMFAEKKIAKFNLPLTDFDFLKLHSMFMQLTYSTFQTSDVIKGRIIIQKALISLNYYQSLACLTLAQPVSNRIVDIFQIIQKHAQVYGLHHAINQFFIDHAQLDFIWVEMTEDLIVQFGQSNIDYFVQIMTQNKAIPVIIVEYNS